MKLGAQVALAWCFKAYQENDREVVKHFSVDRSDFLQYAVPGFVFFAQNNLSFLALQHMNSSAFQLLMNTRIVSVAILAVIMLNKRIRLGVDLDSVIDGGRDAVPIERVRRRRL